MVIEGGIAFHARQDLVVAVHFRPHDHILIS